MYRASVREEAYIHHEIRRNSETFPSITCAAALLYFSDTTVDEFPLPFLPRAHCQQLLQKMPNGAL